MDALQGNRGMDHCHPETKGLIGHFHRVKEADASSSIADTAGFFRILQDNEGERSWKIGGTGQNLEGSVE